MTSEITAVLKCVTLLFILHKVQSQQQCTIYSSGVSDDEISTIVNAHNNYRSTVAKGQQSGQPAAKNMREIVWDVNIASEAQKWANRCKFEHTKFDSSNTAGYDSLGQNLAADTSNSADWNRVVTDWFNEVTQFDPNNISPFQFSGSTGHYTQVVWADTYAIGCGYINYNDGGQWTGLYVCDYGPAGNWKEGTMYATGNSGDDVCTQCPEGTSFCVNGLCRI